MKSPYTHPERVPASAVARLQKNLSQLIASFDTVLASTDVTDPATPRLQRAVALLRREDADLQMQVEAFQKGDREPLLRRAADLRLLAQRMDGYTPASLPDDAVKELVETRQHLVLTAWQIAAAASGSEAAGL